MKSKTFLASLVAVSAVSFAAMADEAVPVQPTDPAPTADVDPLSSPAPLPPSAVDVPVQQTTVVEASPVAQPAPIESAEKTNKYPLKGGLVFDLSLPSGVALGGEVRLPYLPYFKVGAAMTYTLAPGLRANILLDPIKFPVAPIANFDLGHQFGFSLPSLKNSPTVDFTYEDIQGGIGFGNRDGFRFMILGGMTHLSGTAHNFQGVITNSPAGLTIADPQFSGWIPSAKLGFNWLF
jgi:hypothetical protein